MSASLDLGIGTAVFVDIVMQKEGYERGLGAL
jgi:hypothetical protein